MRSVLTYFSKGVKGSAGLSFSRSASANCDKKCKMFNNGCYSEWREKFYRAFGQKLTRHGRTSPHNLIYRAIAELDQLKDLKWFRLSVSGSIPPRTRIKDFPAFARALRELAAYLANRKVPLHFPVESYSKARMARAILQGFPVVVRRSIQSFPNLFKAKDHSSFVVPPTVPYNMLAGQLREAGKTVVVCPAIVGDSKCGKCKACASNLVDIVLYPKHR